MKQEEYENLLMGSGLLTEKQLQAIHAVYEFGSLNEASLQINVKPTTISDRICRARRKVAKAGFTHRDANVSKFVGEGYKVKGLSTYTTLENGDKQWVKTEQDKEKQMELMRTAVSALCSEIDPIEPIDFKGGIRSENLINEYVITDYHLGMLAWHEEGGADWNLPRAQCLLTSAITDMITRSPKADKAVLVILGDFLHFDGLLPVTPASRHVLDADSRFTQIVRVAIQCIRDCVTKLIEEHNEVDLLICTGNHDEGSSVWMREAFNLYYEDNQRITVITTPSPYYAIAHGDVGLFYHHGHKVKFESLPAKFMTICHDVFAVTHKWFGNSGHLHSARKGSATKDFNGFEMTQHPTLAASDSYASDHGMDSQRKAFCTTFHRKYGEYSRISTSPAMFD